MTSSDFITKVRLSLDEIKTSNVGHCDIYAIVKHYNRIINDGFIDLSYKVQVFVNKIYNWDIITFEQFKEGINIDRGVDNTLACVAAVMSSMDKNLDAKDVSSVIHFAWAQASYTHFERMGEQTLKEQLEKRAGQFVEYSYLSNEEKEKDDAIYVAVNTIINEFTN